MTTMRWTRRLAGAVPLAGAVLLLLMATGAAEAAENLGHAQIRRRAWRNVDHS